MRINGKTPVWMYMTVVFVVLQLADAVLTCVGVHFHGLEMEANPFAALTFAKYGIYQGAIAAKVFSFAVFFGMLMYCIKVRWNLLDIVRWCRGEPMKRDRRYAMACFNGLAVVVILASLYASGGWVYILMFLERSQ